MPRVSVKVGPGGVFVGPGGVFCGGDMTGATIVTGSGNKVRVGKKRRGLVTSDHSVIVVGDVEDVTIITSDARPIRRKR